MKSKENKKIRKSTSWENLYKIFPKMKRIISRYKQSWENSLIRECEENTTKDIAVILFEKQNNQVKKQKTKKKTFKQKKKDYKKGYKKGLELVRKREFVDLNSNKDYSKGLEDAVKKQGKFYIDTRTLCLEEDEPQEEIVLAPIEKFYIVDYHLVGSREGNWVKTTFCREDKYIDVSDGMDKEGNTWYPYYSDSFFDIQNFEESEWWEESDDDELNIELNEKITLIKDIYNAYLEEKEQQKKQILEAIVIDCINNSEDKTMNLLLKFGWYSKEELQYLYLEEGYLYDERIVNEDFSSQPQAVTGWELFQDSKIKFSRRRGN